MARVLHVRPAGVQTPLRPGEFASEIRSVVELGELGEQADQR